jgi:hypothetical protein
MPVRRSVLAALVGAGALVALAGCGTGDDAAATRTPSSTLAGADSSVAQRFPDVRSVVLARDDDGTYTLEVTVSSPYDTPTRYADGWRVLTPDGTVLGEHTLGHDHAAEQPFTRTQTGLAIPDDVDEVTVEGRDLVNGFGGTTATVAVPRS